jgi:hypothetical protein
MAWFNYEWKHHLRDGDRNAARWAIEPRSPFMDYRLLCRTNRLPLAQLMKRGWSKYIARSFTDGHDVPRRIMWNRAKKGLYERLACDFERVWLDSILSQRTTLDRHLGDFLDVDRLLGLARQGKVKLWKLLSVTVLLDRMNEVCCQARPQYRAAA